MDKSKNKPQDTKQVILGLVIIGVLIFAGYSVISAIFGSNNEKKESSTQSQIDTKYELITHEDVSVGNAKRFLLRVVVAYPTSEDILKATADKIISDEKDKQPFNALAINFYDRKEFASGAYSLAKVEYAPNGQWAEASSVSMGDYSSSKNVYDFKQKVSSPDQFKDKQPTNEQAKIYSEYESVKKADNFIQSTEDQWITKTAQNLDLTPEKVKQALQVCIYWLNY